MIEKVEDQAKQDEPKATRGRQPRPEDQAKQDDGHLITMLKDGDSLKVHPSCVADHMRMGWVEA